MKERHLIVAGRIRRELDDLAQVVERAVAAAGRGDGEQELFIDAAALNLHDFYTGLERIFQHIADAVDNSIPSGRDWRRDLLYQMSMPIARVRPQVLSPQTTTLLREYLGFRHVVRNVYAFHFDAARVEQLVDGLSKLFPQIQTELREFIEFLERVEMEKDGVE